MTNNTTNHDDYMYSTLSNKVPADLNGPIGISAWEYMDRERRKQEIMRRDWFLTATPEKSKLILDRTKFVAIRTEPEAAGSHFLAKPQIYGLLVSAAIVATACYCLVKLI